MRRSLFILSLVLNALFGKDLQIIHMEGTFDLDNDGLVEFAAVEVGRDNGHSVSRIRYYEIVGDGYQQLNWELSAPDGLLGNFVTLAALWEPFGGSEGDNAADPCACAAGPYGRTVTVRAHGTYGQTVRTIRRDGLRTCTDGHAPCGR